MYFGFVGDLVTGEWVQCGDAVDFVAEELDADGELLVHRNDFNGIATHAERSAREGNIIALVLHIHELAQQGLAVNLLAFLEEQHLCRIFLRSTQTIDARHGCHNDAVTSGEQRGSRRVAQALHVVVDIGILLDISIRLWDIGFRLVVVVVTHEVVDGIVRHEFAELCAQLCRQRLIWLDDERGTLQLLDHPRRGGGLARSRGAHEHHVVLTVVDAVGEILDCLRLIPRWLIGRLDHKRLVDSLQFRRRHTTSHMGCDSLAF